MHFEQMRLYFYLHQAVSLSIQLVGVMTSVSWPLDYFGEDTAACLISSLTYHQHSKTFQTFKNL